MPIRQISAQRGDSLMSSHDHSNSPVFEPVTMHVSPQVHEHAEAIKEATRLKSSGDLSAAVEQCKASIAIYERAYGRAPSAAKFTNTLCDYFKLARYLAEAGRVEEAWAVLSNRLRAAGASRNAFDASGVPIDRSLVYSEMRKLAARTGDYISALKYAAAEMVAWNQGLVLQQRIQELPSSPIGVDDLPRYVRTYCSRLESRFTVSDFAAFLNSAYEDAEGKYTSINLRRLQDEAALLIANTLEQPHPDGAKR